MKSLISHNLKSRYLTFILLLGGIFAAFAQTPGIPYQAYFTTQIDVPGEQVTVPLANANVMLEFIVRDENGNIEYVEHIPVTTDAYGLASTVVGIGNGTPQNGTNFDDIDWNNKKKTLGVGIDFSNTGSFDSHDTMDIVNVPSVATATAGLSSGVGAPTGTDPANPSAGDIYVDESTGDIYTYDGMNWGKTGGAETGTGAPTGTDPANPAGGDIYVDESTGDVYTYNSTTNTWENQSSTLDGNTTHIVRADAITDVAPSAAEVVDPIEGDTAHVALDNDTVEYWSHDGTAWTKDYSVTANTRQYVARYTAASGDIDFDAPQAITELDNIDAYRNGVRIDFSQVDADTIKLDLGTLTGCYAGDEIRIVQLK